MKLHALRMYDATPDGVSAIPSNAEAVAGYIVEPGEHFQSYPLLVHRFHGKCPILSIGIHTDSLAAIVDVEPGNPVTTPAEVRQSWEIRKAHGIWRPGFYADLTRMHETVIPGLAGIPRSEYRLWLAKWNGIPEIPPGFDAVQFESLRLFDESEVAADFFHPASLPKPSRPKGPAAHPAGTFKAQLDLHEGGGWDAHGIHSDGVILGGPDEWDEARVGVNRRRGIWKIAPLPKVRAFDIHPKAAAATGGGTIVTAVLGALSAAKSIHLSPAEISALTTAVSGFSAWLAPHKR